MNMAAAAPSAKSFTTGLNKLLDSGSDEFLEQRKRKRMISNRESAKRSRMRKQKHLDDLLGQVCHLKSDNKCIATNLRATTQMFLMVDAENSVLRAQLAELTHRLESVNEIISEFNSTGCDHTWPETDYDVCDDEVFVMCGVDEFLNFQLHDNQPVMVDMFLN